MSCANWPRHSSGIRSSTGVNYAQQPPSRPLKFKPSSPTRWVVSPNKTLKQQSESRSRTHFIYLGSYSSGEVLLLFARSSTTSPHRSICVLLRGWMDIILLLYQQRYADFPNIFVVLSVCCAQVADFGLSTCVAWVALWIALA